MESRIAEMRDLLVRVRAIDELGTASFGDALAEQQAIHLYKEMKEDLALRMKAFNRLRFDGVAPWFELAYDAGIRHAHQAMIARAGSSPKNPKWHTAVQALASELEYYLAKLEKGSLKAAT